MSFVYSVQLNDPDHLSQDAVLVAVINAALADWSNYLVGQGTLEVQVNVTPTSSGRASGRSATNFVVGTDGTRSILEEGAAHELITGIDPNGASPDIIIDVDKNYLVNELWLDPDPAHPSTIPSNRTDGISVFRHELMHAFAMNGFRNLSTGILPAAFESKWDKFVVTHPDGSASFVGQTAQALFGGLVPVTTLTNGQQYTHLGNSATDPIVGQDLMNGVVFLRGHSYNISALDLAILADLGLATSSVPISRGNYDSARFGDFDNNGRSEVLFQSDAGAIVIWQTNSAGALSNVVSVGSLPAGFRIDGTGNFNSTAGHDILLRSPTSVAVLPMNGTTAQPMQVLGGTSPLWLNSGIGDFTGDGQSDLLFRNVSTGEIATWAVTNNALSTAPKVLGSTAPQYHIVAVDDFTGDQQADILFRHDNGDIAIWRVANNALAGAPAVTGSTSPSYHVVGTGDFDGNGSNDILFRNDNGDLAMWLLNSSGALLRAPAAVGNASIQYRVEGTGDLNGDGRTDIIFRDGNGTLIEWLMNGAAFAAAPAVLGTQSIDYSIAAHHFDLI